MPSSLIGSVTKSHPSTVRQDHAQIALERLQLGNYPQHTLVAIAGLSVAAEPTKMSVGMAPTPILLAKSFSSSTSTQRTSTCTCSDQHRGKLEQLWHMQIIGRPQFVLCTHVAWLRDNKWEMPL
eukprot:365817-Chlamydomonas_euryale.AAC.7